MPYYNQPSDREIARRRVIAATAETFILLPRDENDGHGLSLIPTAETAVLTSDVTEAVRAMMAFYPEAKTGVNRAGREVSAIDTAIFQTRNVWKARQLPVDTATEEGKYFGLASFWFRKAIEDAERQLDETTEMVMEA